MSKWESIEATLPEYRSMYQKRRLHKRIESFALIFFICAAAEDFLTSLSTAYNVNYCTPNENQIKAFLIIHFDQFFTFTEYALWKGILLKLVRILGMIVWNYTNVFVIMISLGISSRFQQLNDEINRAKGKVNVILFIIII